MKAARFTVSPEILRQALHLPETAEIVSAETRPIYGAPGLICVELVVTDPSIPDAAGPHDTSPLITRTAPVEESFQWDWNIE